MYASLNLISIPLFPQSVSNSSTDPPKVLALIISPSISGVSLTFNFEWSGLDTNLFCASSLMFVNSKLPALICCFTKFLSNLRVFPSGNFMIYPTTLLRLSLILSVHTARVMLIPPI